MLPCHHAFCLGCLQDVYDQAVRENPSATDLVCPMCKAPVSLPGGLVANLPADFRANQVNTVLEMLLKEKDSEVNKESTRAGDLQVESKCKSDKTKCWFCVKNGISTDATVFCIDCGKVCCAECHELHRERFENHIYGSVNTEDVLGLICQEHDEDFIQSFCLTCERGICQSCSIGSHRKHKIDDFTTETSSDYTSVIRKIIDKGKELENMYHQIAFLEKKEQNDAETIKASVQQHKEQVIRELEETQREILCKMEDNIQRNETELRKCGEFVSEAQERLSRLRNRYRMAKEPIPELSDISLKKSEAVFAKEASDGVASMVYRIPDIPTHTFIPNKPTKLGLYDVNVPSDLAEQTSSGTKLIRAGDRVGASEAMLLNMLKICPFTFGSQIRQDLSAIDLAILEISHDNIRTKFMAGVANLASVSLAIGYPTMASAPHSIVKGFKNLLAVAVATNITFKEADDFLANRSKLATLQEAAV